MKRYRVGTSMPGWHNTHRLSTRLYGGVKPNPKPVQHGKWVLDINVLIIIERKIGEF